LGRLSALTFNSVEGSQRPEITQHNGRAFFFSRGSRSEPSIKTPLVTAAIYGTELVVDVTNEKTTIDVLHGSIKAFNKGAEESANAGESVTAKQGGSLSKTILVKPVNAVQWMIRFPFIVSTHDIVPETDSTCATRCVEHLTQTITAAQRGSTLYAQLQNLPHDLRSLPRAKLLSAISLWQVGDAPGARSLLANLSTPLSARDEALREILLGFSDLQSNDLAGAQQHVTRANNLQPD
jgi:hypothetical protein